MSNRSILLNPGPVTLTDGVRHALTRGDWCHREPEFAELTTKTNRRLVDVYEADQAVYASVLLTGSGTCAVEAMLSTFAPRESATLVVANGVYGERIADMLDAMQAPTVVVRGDWAAAIDFEAIEARLRDHDRLKHVVAVQHETTTGRLNDIGRLGELCVKYDASLLLDSVSAFGAEEIKFEKWNLLALAATANKCLHAVPGISFVIARRDALAQSEPQTRSVYMNLRHYYATQHADGYSPFTLAVQCLFALDAALDEFFDEGGWRARRARYLSIAATVRDHLERLGLDPLLKSGDRSSAMQSFFLPTDSSYQQLHDRLKALGFVIYAGQGQLSGRMFRIANMGAILDVDVERLNRALTLALDKGK